MLSPPSRKGRWLLKIMGVNRTRWKRAFPRASKRSEVTQSRVQGPRKICFCYANLDFLKVPSNTSFLDVNFLYVGFVNLSFGLYTRNSTCGKSMRTLKALKRNSLNSSQIINNSFMRAFWRFYHVDKCYHVRIGWFAKCTDSKSS